MIRLPTTHGTSTICATAQLAKMPRQYSMQKATVLAILNSKCVFATKISHKNSTLDWKYHKLNSACLRWCFGVGFQTDTFVPVLYATSCSLATVNIGLYVCLSWDLFNSMKCLWCVFRINLLTMTTVMLQSVSALRGQLLQLHTWWSVLLFHKLCWEFLGQPFPYSFF